MNLLLIALTLPAAAALAALLTPPPLRRGIPTLAVLACGATLAAGLAMWGGHLELSAPWAGYGFEFALKLSPLNNLLLCAVAAVYTMAAAYSAVTGVQGRLHYTAILLFLSFSSGFLLADNLLLMAFFIQGIAFVRYITLILPDTRDEAAALKILLLESFAGMLIAAAAGITVFLSGNFQASAIAAQKLPTAGLGLAAILMFAAAAAVKTSAFPFSGWLSAISTAAPRAFGAFHYCAAMRLTGVYLLCLAGAGFFPVQNSLAASEVLIWVGAATLVFGAVRAFAARHSTTAIAHIAASQSGWLFAGLGAGGAAGITGVLSAVLIQAAALACLFIIPKNASQADTAAPAKPYLAVIATACFIAAALSLAGMPPFGGYFAVSLIYDALLQSGHFAAAAVCVAATGITTAVLARLCRDFCFTQQSSPSSEQPAGLAALAPAIILAGFCLVTGFGGKIAFLDITGRAAAWLSGDTARALWGWKLSHPLMPAASVLIGALLFYSRMFFKNNHPQGPHPLALRAPLGPLFALARRGVFDIYNIGIGAAFFIGRGFYVIDTGIAAALSVAPQALLKFTGRQINRLHTGNYKHYLALMLLGLIIFAVIASYTGGAQ